MLYHISLGIGKKVKEFIPRIPKGRCKILNENLANNP